MWMSKRYESHGMHGTRIYNIWQGLRYRCYNPKSSNYYLYGGKGISVCEEWDNSFISFYEWSKNKGYQEHLTIDRIDSNKDYCPENCRWATYKQQLNNTSRNHYLTYEGETLTIAQWAKKINIHRSTLRQRIKRGWSVEKSVTEPAMKIDNFGNFMKERNKSKV